MPGVSNNLEVAQVHFPLIDTLFGSSLHYKQSVSEGPLQFKQE